jgi:signal transduction histidine kinase
MAGVNRSQVDLDLTPPSDLGNRQFADDRPMPFAPALVTPPLSPLSIKRLNVRHRRALHAISGSVVSWVYMVLLFILLPLSLSLVIIWVGVPMLVGTLAAVRGCAAMERRMAVTLLDVNIAAPPKVSEMRTAPMGQLRAIITHGATWRGLGYTLVRFITGMVMFFVVTVFGALAIGLMVTPFAPGSIRINDTQGLGGWASWWAPPVGLVIGIAGWYLSSFVGQLHGWIAPILLGPSETDRVRVLEGRTAKLSAQTQLARELHDSVGHTMTSVVVQAGAAKRVFDTNPKFAREALGEIETSARQALVELDYTIAMLRTDQAQPTGHSPLPTLFDVERLIVSSKRSGLNVIHTLTGDPGAVPIQVSREAFRIVQEGLTNVTKHAPGARTELSVELGFQQLTILIINPLPQPGPAPSDRVGNGLRGISERVNALGGVMWVGPVEDTHVLRAVIPFDPSHQ